MVLCSGIAFVITSGANYLFYEENCLYQNKSVEDFQACVKQSMTKTPLIRKFGIESFDKQVHMSSYAHIDMILPKNGSIGTTRNHNNPTFELDPGYAFLLFFLDKNFFFFVSNPLLVHRSVVTVHSNTSYVYVGLKVSIFGINYKLS